MLYTYLMSLDLVQKNSIEKILKVIGKQYNLGNIMGQFYTLLKQ